jgi:hypothetical protein
VLFSEPSLGLCRRHDLRHATRRAENCPKELANIAMSKLAKKTSSRRKGAPRRMKKPIETHDEVALTDDLPLADEPELESDSDEPTHNELADEEIALGEDVTGEDDRIDDPVRIYLMQMGEIPLLSVKEELISAKRIERGRVRFRHCMLANDYVLQAAASLLENIRDNKVRLDRTIEVSVINVREKRRCATAAISRRRSSGISRRRFAAPPGGGS